MKSREKILAAIVGGVLAVAGLYQVTRALVLAPFAALDRGIREQKSLRNEYRERLTKLRMVDQDWAMLVGRTLSHERVDARERFYQDMQQLLEMHGLADINITPNTEQRLPNGLIEVPLTIKAAGTLRSINGFLLDFYRRDYLARIVRVKLNADESQILASASAGTPAAAGPEATPVAAAAPGKERGKSTKPAAKRAANTPKAGGTGDARVMTPEGPRIMLNVNAATLILPRLPGIDAAPQEAIRELPQGRLASELTAYSAIVDRSLFKLWSPPPPPPPPPPAHVGGPASAGAVAATQPDSSAPVAAAPPPPPPPPSRPDADKYTLNGVSAGGGQFLALVRDTRKPTEPTQEIPVGESMDDGVLILVHPLGAVVRVMGGPGGKPQYFFYELGGTFKDRVEVDSVAHPEIAQELGLVASRS